VSDGALAQQARAPGRLAHGGRRHLRADRLGAVLRRKSGRLRRALAGARTVTLTSAAFAQLARVNLQVNREIEQVTDMDHFGVEEYWTYPVAGKGDCEDLVLEKKRRLIALGVPREAMLITVVRDLKGDGHAILTVVTDRGDYILDNFTNEVKLWHETGYRFIKRQSQTDPNQWVSLNGGAAGPQLVANPRR
jgi:predicted transglutaminase-like cysteine proteinase